MEKEHAAHTAREYMSGKAPAKARAEAMRNNVARSAAHTLWRPGKALAAVLFGLAGAVIYFLGSPPVMLLFLIKVLSEMCNGKWKKAMRSMALTVTVPLWMPVVIMRRGYGHVISGRVFEFSLDEF